MLPKRPLCTIQSFFLGIFNFAPMSNQCSSHDQRIIESSTSKPSFTMQLIIHYRLAIQCMSKKSHWFNPIPSNFFGTYQSECRVQPMGGAT